MVFGIGAFWCVRVHESSLPNDNSHYNEQDVVSTALVPGYPYGWTLGVRMLGRSCIYFYTKFFCIFTNLLFCRHCRTPVPDGVFVWFDTLPILGLCSLLFFVCVPVLQYRMLDPGHMVESVTVEEDPHEALPIISVETNDDGTTRRTETTVSLL